MTLYGTLRALSKMNPMNGKRSTIRHVLFQNIRRDEKVQKKWDWNVEIGPLKWVGNKNGIKFLISERGSDASKFWVKIIFNNSISSWVVKCRMLSYIQGVKNFLSSVAPFLVSTWMIDSTKTEKKALRKKGEVQHQLIISGMKKRSPACQLCCSLEQPF